MKFNQVDINGKSGSVEELVYDSKEGASVDHHVYLAVHNQRKKGHVVTASVKTRGMVRGGGAKPFNQKGTGRARCGTSRSPLKVGGGCIFGPTPRVRRHKVSPKVIKDSILFALTTKKDQLYVLDASAKDIKTKDVGAFLSKLNVSKKQRVLFVLSSTDEVLKRASRNLENITLVGSTNIHVSKVLSTDVVVFTKDSFVSFKEGIQS